MTACGLVYCRLGKKRKNKKKGTHKTKYKQTKQKAQGPYLEYIYIDQRL